MIFVSVYYLINASYLTDKIGITKINQNFLFFFFLSITPFYYLYTQSLTNIVYKFRPVYLLHFLPSAIFLILSFIVINFYSSEESEKGLINYSNLKLCAVIIYNLQILYCTIGMFILLYKHNINLRNYFSFKNIKNNLIWLRVFIIIFVIFSVLDLMIYYLKSLEYLELFYYTLSILFFTFLGYFGIKQSDIYSKARLAEITADKTNPVVTEDEVKLSEKKQILSEDRSKKLMMDIVEIMNTEKIYRNPELSIFDIAKRTSVNKTYISYVINEYLQENFSNFINRFRIEDAKALLKDKKYNNYTLEGIANLVGFHSKSSFNIAFKKFTGMIPSQYKKSSGE